MRSGLEACGQSLGGRGAPQVGHHPERQSLLGIGRAASGDGRIGVLNQPDSFFFEDVDRSDA
jgi:hypothetical protein